MIWNFAREEQKTKTRPPNVIYEVILTWNGESNDDLDLYVQAASGHVVSFNNREMENRSRKVLNFATTKKIAYGRTESDLCSGV